MTTTPSPPEPDGGQDFPPDLHTAVVAVLGLLADVLEHLERRPDESIRLRARIVAHRRALVRLRDDRR